MTSRYNQPDWITLQEEFFGITENHSIEYRFNINSDGDCLVWLQQIDSDSKVLYKTKPKYFTTTDEACEWLQKQTKAYLKFIKDMIRDKARMIDLIRAGQMSTHYIPD